MFQTDFHFNSLMKCTDDSYRYKWIINTLNSLNISYELQQFGTYTNIICKGKTDVWVCAHYDTIDIKHCANDNSASIVNLIHLKTLLPDLSVVFLDAEEPPHFGLGSENFSRYIKENNIPVKYILNLELTGFGNCVCIGYESGKSKEFFMEEFDNFSSNLYVTELSTPINDTTIFLENGIDSTLLMLLPIEDGLLKEECMYYCHTSNDKIDNINFKDMDRLVNTLSVILGKEIE